MKLEEGRGHDTTSLLTMDLLCTSGGAVYRNARPLWITPNQDLYATLYLFTDKVVAGDHAHD